MRHSTRTKSYELEIAKREYFAETMPTKDFQWEDELGYEIDDTEYSDHYESYVDLFDLYRRNF